MELPGEAALREERSQLVETMTSLSDDAFDHAPTLCEGWAPRHILAHVVGVDTDLAEYVKALGNIRSANHRIVAKLGGLPRDELLRRARRWAQRPALTSRAAAWYLLGDDAMHHQDVLRPLGRSREIPEASKDAILREGLVLGAKKLVRYRVVPTDGGRPIGRGHEVRGTREALGLWLAGRRGVEPELTFSGRRSM